VSDSDRVILLAIGVVRDCVDRQGSLIDSSGYGVRGLLLRLQRSTGARSFGSVAQADTEGISVVPVLIATTRSRSTANAGEMFDSRRAEGVSYASVVVSIPPDAARKTGEVQWPASLPGSPQESFVTVSANHLDKQSFVSDLSAAAKRNERSKVLVFVHGFNNRFDQAVYRFAQITHDSRAPAIPDLFSWPSRGVVGLRAYQDDLESANDSRDALEQLLDTIGGNVNVKEVTILYHSMGCLPTL
jgi:esterase/lipase superfamily enzyme